MSHSQVLDKIRAIDPNNEFINYIWKRIQGEFYRGKHLSQHNRYNLDKLAAILEGIQEIISDEKFSIPPGDSKTRIKKPEYKNYYDIINIINQKYGIVASPAFTVTEDSLKKNLFVEFARMGILARFKKNGERIEEFNNKDILNCLNEYEEKIKNRRRYPRFIQLTPLAIKFLNSDLMKRHQIFTDALYKLVGDEASNLVNALYSSNYKNDALHLDEYMLIFSDHREEVQLEKINLLTSFRSLQKHEKIKVKKLIREYCSPKKFSDDKKAKRDYNNWRNESQQIFHLFSNTLYFDISKNELKLKTNKTGIFSDNQLKTRSVIPKKEYFDNHNLIRQNNFELHHIIPISAARNKKEFTLIDNWQNLIYLLNTKHKELTSKGNTNVVLHVKQSNLHFDDFNSMRISASNNSTAAYDSTHSNVMEKYNRNLLKEIYEYEIESEI